MASFFNIKSVRRSLFTHLFAMATTIYLSLGSVLAADLTLSDSPFCQVKLAGAIKSGDTERLISFTKSKNVADPQGNEIGYALCLDSPGGSLNEAMDLARYFQEEVVATVINKNDECLSACAVAFMFGTEAVGDYVGSKRAMHVSARLGFHRPALKVPSRSDYTDEQIEKALQIVLDSVVDLMVEANNVNFNHSQSIMAADLIQEMFSHEGDDFYKIETVDQVGRWNIQVLGWTPPERLDLHHAHNACINMLSWPVGFSSSFQTFDYASGIDVSEYGAFEYAGDGFGVVGSQRAQKPGYEPRMSVSIPSPSGDDNGGGWCIFSADVSKLDSDFDGPQNALRRSTISGCGSNTSTSVGFGQGECTGYVFGQNPFGEDFYFDQFIPAISIANPKSSLSDLASQRAFRANEYETDCFVFRNGAEIERNKCKARITKERHLAGDVYDKIFVWPSGNRTIISHKPNGININGKIGLPRKITNKSRFDECITNTQSGNEFCHGLRDN